MKHISHKLQVINKSDLEKSIIKASWNDEFKPAKQKHLKKCLDIFQGKCSIDNYAILMNYMKQISIKKWVYSAKILYIVQASITNSQTVDLCDYIHHDSNEFKKLRQDLLKNVVKPEPHLDQYQYLTSQFIYYYFKYIMKFAQNIRVFLKIQERNLEVIHGNEEEILCQKYENVVQCIEDIEIVMKVLEIILFIFDKNLQHMLVSKYSNKYEFLKQLTVCLYGDLEKYYVKCRSICEICVQLIPKQSQNLQIAKKMYQFYCEFIKFTKNIQRVDFVLNYCQPLKTTRIQYFQLNPTVNKQIEMFINGLNKQQFGQQKNNYFQDKKQIDNQNSEHQSKNNKSVSSAADKVNTNNNNKDIKNIQNEEIPFPQNNKPISFQIEENDNIFIKKSRVSYDFLQKNFIENAENLFSQKENEKNVNKESKTIKKNNFTEENDEKQIKNQQNQENEYENQILLSRKQNQNSFKARSNKTVSQNRALKSKDSFSSTMAQRSDYVYIEEEKITDIYYMNLEKSKMDQNSPQQFFSQNKKTISNEKKEEQQKEEEPKSIYQQIFQFEFNNYQQYGQQQQENNNKTENFNAFDKVEIEDFDKINDCSSPESVKHASKLSSNNISKGKINPLQKIQKSNNCEDNDDFNYYSSQNLLSSKRAVKTQEHETNSLQPIEVFEKLTTQSAKTSAKKFNFGNKQQSKKRITKVPSAVNVDLFYASDQESDFEFDNLIQKPKPQNKIKEIFQTKNKINSTNNLQDSNLEKVKEKEQNNNNVYVFTAQQQSKFFNDENQYQKQKIHKQNENHSQPKSEEKQQITEAYKQNQFYENNSQLKQNDEKQKEKFIEVNKQYQFNENNSSLKQNGDNHQEKSENKQQTIQLNQQNKFNDNNSQLKQIQYNSSLYNDQQKPNNQQQIIEGNTFNDNYSSLKQQQIQENEDNYQEKQENKLLNKEFNLQNNLKEDNFYQQNDSYLDTNKSKKLDQKEIFINQSDQIQKDHQQFDFNQKKKAIIPQSNSQQRLINKQEDGLFESNGNEVDQNQQNKMKKSFKYRGSLQQINFNIQKSSFVENQNQPSGLAPQSPSTSKAFQNKFFLGNKNFSSFVENGEKQNQQNRKQTPLKITKNRKLEGQGQELNAHQQLIENQVQKAIISTVQQRGSFRSIKRFSTNKSNSSSNKFFKESSIDNINAVNDFNKDKQDEKNYHNNDDKLQVLNDLKVSQTTKLGFGQYSSHQREQGIENNHTLSTGTSSIQQQGISFQVNNNYSSKFNIETKNSPNHSVIIDTNFSNTLDSQTHGQKIIQNKTEEVNNTIFDESLNTQSIYNFKENNSNFYSKKAGIPILRQKMQTEPPTLEETDKQRAFKSSQKRSVVYKTNNPQEQQRDNEQPKIFNDKLEQELRQNLNTSSQHSHILSQIKNRNVLEAAVQAMQFSTSVRNVSYSQHSQQKKNINFKDLQLNSVKNSNNSSINKLDDLKTQMNLKYQVLNSSNIRQNEKNYFENKTQNTYQLKKLNQDNRFFLNDLLPDSIKNIIPSQTQLFTTSTKTYENPKQHIFGSKVKTTQQQLLTTFPIQAQLNIKNQNDHQQLTNF